jgi:hypothetical protein
MRNHAIVAYLTPLIVGCVGVLLCIIASSNCYHGKWELFKINADYTAIGWVFRIIGGIIGSFSLYLCIPSNNVMPRKKIHGFGLIVAFAAIVWEVAVIGIIIAFIIIALGSLGG